MTPETPPYQRNVLEPPGYVELFTAYPPVGFDSYYGSEFSTFCTDFTLLTTLEPKTLRKLAALPFFSRWASRLSLYTCFAGTTITEYAPLPGGRHPDEILDLVHTAASQSTRKPSLTIIKDLPCSSPLLGKRENDFADALAIRARTRGFMEIEGQALAYVHIDFSSIDTYLSHLSSASRKDLRRKMKKRHLLDLEVLPLGHSRFNEQPFLDTLYAMYQNVYRQSDVQFDLLSPAFFSALLHSQTIPGVVFCYHHNGSLIGHNICLLHENRLIDKYIGLVYPQARELNLYFISWMINLEYAVANGLSAYIAGWTDPEVKAGLGARFTFTRHLVHIANPLLRGILAPFRKLFEGDRQRLEAR